MSKRRTRVNDGRTWYNIPLCMSVPDIAKNYREAKRPAEQINILADMNDTLPCRIAWILKRCGCEVSGKKLPRPPRKDDTIDYVALWEQSEDARICDEYRITKENEAMEITNETHPAMPAVVQSEPQPVKPCAASRPAESVYTDAVDIFWNTYMNVRYGVTLNHDDIMHLIGLSDIARAAAGGAQ